MISGKEWDNVNTLLSFLRSSNVVNLVDEYYKQYNNEAPAMLLSDQMAIVQRDLNAGGRN